MALVPVRQPRDRDPDRAHVAAAARQPGQIRHRPKIDVPGVLTGSGGLFALVYGFSNAETHSWTAPVTIIALVASVVLLVSFVLIEQRAAHPLLPLHIVWNRARGGAYASIALAGVGVFAVFLFLTYFMQDNLGLSPLTTGVAFLPMTALIVLSSTTAQTRILPRTGAKPLIVTGMVLGLVAMLLLTRLSPGSSYAGDVLPSLLILGLGMGLIFAPAFGTATLGVDAQRGRRRLGDGQHLPAGRRLGRHLAAQHALRQLRGRLRQPHPGARTSRPRRWSTATRPRSGGPRESSPSGW